ncbi:unnamed protein product [Tetraodon nigroviridis]|uniref:(spotted green pufferfish) hypothetical protein n=1 Tax=Tetraodon nigroviridis TaxID=99883 RepID=Q4SDS3_TETNG|nr:unnamed protein product [Tetraodon nigroviridis]
MALMDKHKQVKRQRLDRICEGLREDSGGVSASGGRGEGSRPQTAGKRASCLFKRRQGPAAAPGPSRAMLMRLVLVGRPSKQPRAIGGPPWGRVWAWRTAGIQPASPEQADKPGRKRAREGRVGGRKTGSQTS